MVTSATPRWAQHTYQRICSAHEHAGTLDVCFEDGTQAQVQTARLVPHGSKEIDWSHLSVTPYEVTVPAADGPIVIPWSRIRTLTDAEYAAHLAAAAAEEAQRIGLRIRALRERRGLTGKQLADRAGITPQSVSRIEHGHHDIVFTTLRRILAAMDCTLRDLSDE